MMKFSPPASSTTVQNSLRTVNAAMVKMRSHEMVGLDLNSYKRDKEKFAVNVVVKQINFPLGLLVNKVVISTSTSEAMVLACS